MFRIFPVLRINGMAPFCNLFMERPSYVSTSVQQRIYDYLLSAAATPGGQLFRQRQQQLPKSQQTY